MKTFLAILLTFLAINPGHSQYNSESASQRFAQRYSKSYSQWYYQQHSRRKSQSSTGYYQSSSTEPKHHVLSVDFIGRHLTFIGLSYEYQVIINDNFAMIPKAGISLFSPGRFNFGFGLAYGFPNHKFSAGLSYYFSSSASDNTLSLAFEYRFIAPRSGFFLAAGGYFPMEWAFLMPGVSIGKAF